MDLLKLVSTSLLSVAAIFLITKLSGRKQVAQLDFFDYVSGITVGSIAAELATDLEKPWKSLISLIIYGAVSITLNLVAHKLPRTRKYINGTPTLLMSGGKLLRSGFKAARLDLSEFLLLCRVQGYFDLSEIEAAVFEYNGKLSVLPKSANRPATPADLRLDVEEAHIGTEVIMDGRMIGANLMRLGRNEAWLSSRLKQAGYRGAADIFLAVYRTSDGELTLFPMRDK